MTTHLEQRIREKLNVKNILVMSHTVIGYPSLATSEELVDKLVVNGQVDMIELQFPHSEPIADGPVLLKANQSAVKNGTTIDECFKFAAMITARYPDTIFLIMTYYNILFKRGIEKFIKDATAANVAGIITPDITPEDAGDYITACEKYNVSPVFLVTPNTSAERMQTIAQLSKGMVYCVARTGVTGHQTLFTPEFYQYLNRVKGSSSLPIGVGFGIRNKEDVNQLRGKAEIAIMCTKAIELCVNESPAAAGEFFKQLR